MTTKRRTASTGYTSPVRDEAKEATRARILDALVRVVLDDGVHAFSVAKVAERAGISHRTVYRHFASREELLEALSEAIDSAGPPEEAEVRRRKPLFEYAREDGAGALFGALESMRDRATAEFIIGVSLRHNTRGKQQRWAQVQAEARERFPALAPREQLASAAVLRALVSSNIWFHLCVQLGVPVDVAAQGISRTVELVLEDLAQRNDTQTRRKPRGDGKKGRAK
ncbi:MAG TPA: helix-turn-helix domain-containing protein [Myxococcota bacterium]|nr:helix-turn-helix domain-containing protein [Myxococcota bacterium]